MSYATMHVVVAAFALGATSDLPPDLARAVKDYDQAQVHSDIATLSRLITDDYMLVNSDASVEDKQQFLADFNLPGFKIDPYVVEQPVEKVLGDAAMTGGLVHLSWTQDGAHHTRLLRIAYVWVKRDGRWQITFAQVTRVPETPRPLADSTPPRDGQHDFDFEIGTWKTHLRRRLHPLTGSTTWVEYDGTTVVRPVWNGAANLVELNVTGPAGHFEGASLRLYNSDSHQWSLNFAPRSGGSMALPTIGEFKDGRGEFYDQESLNGRAILVRFVISDVTPNSVHFEQAFSADGGKTWEVNWMATDTR